MAKRRGKAKSRRKTKTKVNLFGVAEAILMANVTSQGLFNADLKTFLTGRVGNAAYRPSNTDNVITLPELLNFSYLGVKMGGTQTRPTFTEQTMEFRSVGALEKITENMKANGIMMAGQLIAIPLGFRVVTKLTAKPRRTANKLLDYTGLGVKV